MLKKLIQFKFKDYPFKVLLSERIGYSSINIVKHFRNATFGTHNESRLNCMKNIFTLITILCSISAIAQKDYQLHIDDQTLDIAADEEYTVKINGKSITVKLTANDTISFDSELYTFDPSKE